MSGIYSVKEVFNIQEKKISQNLTNHCLNNSTIKFAKLQAISTDSMDQFDKPKSINGINVDA